MKLDEIRKKLALIDQKTVAKNVTEGSRIPLVLDVFDSLPVSETVEIRGEEASWPILVLALQRMGWDPLQVVFAKHQDDPLGDEYFTLKLFDDLLLKSRTVGFGVIAFDIPLKSTIRKDYDWLLHSIDTHTRKAILPHDWAAVVDTETTKMLPEEGMREFSERFAGKIDLGADDPRHWNELRIGDFDNVVTLRAALKPHVIAMGHDFNELAVRDYGSDSHEYEAQVGAHVIRFDRTHSRARFFARVLPCNYVGIVPSGSFHRKCYVLRTLHYCHGWAGDIELIEQGCDDDGGTSYSIKGLRAEPKVDAFCNLDCSFVAAYPSVATRISIEKGFWKGVLT